MPKVITTVTGEGRTDSSLTDIGHSAIRHAREMRALTHVVAGIVLWATESKDKAVPATVAKHGHHALVRTLIEQARNYDHWKELDKLASGPVWDTDREGELVMVSALDQRIKIAAGKAKALDSLRESCLRIQAGGESAMKQAEDLITKLAALRQQWQMHREKLGTDLDNASDADLLIASGDVEVVIGDRNDNPALTGE